LRLREQRAARALRLRRAAVARPADRAEDRREDEAVSRSRTRNLSPPPGPAQPVVLAVPRRQLGQEARGERHPAGASDRLPDLPPRVADPRITGAAPAQLRLRHTRTGAGLRLGGTGRSRALP